MDSLREKIDSVDKQIIELLAQRMNYVEEIGKYKLHNKVTIFQRRRWERILSSRKKLGKKLGLSEQFIKKLLQLVHKESISKQTEIMNRNKDEDENTY
jgi:chorismate mutase